MKCVLLVLNLLAFVAYSSATTWYFSGTGSISNTGLSETSPFLLSSAQTTLPNVIQARDTILFKRGDTFTISSLTISKANITISSYGSSTSEKPTFNGGLQITSWDSVSNGIYKVDLKALMNKTFGFEIAAAPNIDNQILTPGCALWIDGVQMWIAREPNFIPNQRSRFARFDATSTDNTFKVQPGTNVIVGAWVMVRTSQWSYDSFKVTAFDSTTNIVTCNKAPSSSLYNFKQGWGYYLQGKQEYLDDNGEWLYDYTTGILQLKLGDNPINHKVVLTVGTYIKLTASGINIDGIHLTYFRGPAFFMGKVNDIAIKNCVFDKLFGADYMWTCNRAKFINNLIADCTVYGIQIDIGDSPIITGNTIKNIGLLEGQDDHSATAIALSTINNGLISDNYVEKTGYTGILPAGSFGQIARNVIKNTMLTLNDGGCIYTGGLSHQNSFSYNYCENGLGNMDGTPSPTSGHHTVGLYSDDICYNNTYYMNTVTGYRWGAQYHDGPYIHCISNVFYNNNYAILIQKDVPCSHANQSLCYIAGCLTKDNLMIGSENGLVYSWNTDWETFGTFEGNTYCNTAKDQVVTMYDYTPTFEQWKAAYEPTAKKCTVSTMESIISQYLSSNLVLDSNFSLTGTTSQKWSKYPTNSINISAAHGNECAKQGDPAYGYTTSDICAKVKSIHISGSNMFQSKSPLTSTAGDILELKFVVHANVSTSISVSLLMNHDSYTNVAPPIWNIDVTTQATQVSHFYYVTVTDSSIFIVISMTCTCDVYFDDLYLQKVSLKPTLNASVALKLISNPTNKTVVKTLGNKYLRAYTATNMNVQFDSVNTNCNVKLGPFTSIVVVDPLFGNDGICDSAISQQQGDTSDDNSNNKQSSQNGGENEGETSNSFINKLSIYTIILLFNLL